LGQGKKKVAIFSFFLPAGFRASENSVWTAAEAARF
jgi:hypothetical protein